jgi:hypothetical protein
VAVGVAVVVAVVVAVGASVGAGTVVSAAGTFWAKTGCAWTIKETLSNKRTAPIRTRYSDRECLMGDSPGWTMKPLL